MKRALILATALALTTVAPAFATERMTDSGFLAATECLAYADHRALESEGFNTDALREAVSDNRYRVNPVIRERAERRADQIRRNQPFSESGLQSLRDHREESCAPFFTQGLVQRGGSASS
jgi:hypothetical protein